MTHQDFINEYLRISEDFFYIKNEILYIKSYLDFPKMRITDISELPDNLHIYMWLDIKNTNITKLPKNLYIGTSLYHNDKLTNIHDSIIFGDSEFQIIYNTGLLNMSEKLQMQLIKQDSKVFYNVKNPTEKSKILQKLLWEI